MLPPYLVQKRPIHSKELQSDGHLNQPFTVTLSTSEASIAHLGSSVVFSELVGNDSLEVEGPFAEIERALLKDPE